MEKIAEIKKTADNVGRRTFDINRSGGSTDDISAIKYSIADLMEFVKRYDEEFVFIPPKKGLTEDNIDAVFERYLQRENTANNAKQKTPHGCFLFW